MTEEKADQIIRCVKECWWRVGALLALILGFSVFVMGGWPEMSQTTAAWVQAIGSIIAICVAIFLSHYDKELEKRNKNSERSANNKKQLRVALRVALYMMNTMAGYKIKNGAVERPDFSEIEFMSLMTRIDNAIFIAKKTLDGEYLSEEMFFQILRIGDLGLDIRETLIADYEIREGFTDSDFIKKLCAIEYEYREIGRVINEFLDSVDCKYSTPNHK